MSKLTAEVMKVFAQDAPTAEVAQIGSFKAGVALKTKDIATIQALTEYLDGLSDITGAGANLPLLEDINAMYFLATRQLTYLYQSGIPEWNTLQEYYADVSFVQVAGVIYRSKTGTGGSPNTGNDPTTDAVNWKLGISDPQWTSAALLGSALTIATVGSPALAALDDTDVAFIDGTNAELRTYRFSGSAWAIVGSALSIANGLPVISALNSTDIALFDTTNKELRTYRFNGTTWALVGSGLSIVTAAGLPAVTALNSTDVAFIDSSNQELRTYRFNGTTWALVGSGLSVTSGVPALTTLNSTDVAFYDEFNDELRTYRFNGTTWALVGSGLSIPSGLTGIITAVNGTDIAFVEGNSKELWTYRFNGAVWAKIGGRLSLPTMGAPALAALNGTDVAFIDQTDDELRTYRLGFGLPGMTPYHP